MIFHDKSRSLLKMTTANGQFFAGDSQYIPKIRILLPMQVVSFKMKKVFNGLIHIQVAASIRIAKLGNTQHTHRSHRTEQFRFEVQRLALSCHTTPSELLEMFMASRDLNSQFLHFTEQLRSMLCVYFMQNFTVYNQPGIRGQQLYFYDNDKVT